MGGISTWQLLIVAAIVILLFGTKKLRGIGSDLGGAVKGFKKAMSEEDDKSKSSDAKDAEAPLNVTHQSKTEAEQAEKSTQDKA